MRREESVTKRLKLSSKIKLITENVRRVIWFSTGIRLGVTDKGDPVHVKEFIGI